MVILEFFIEGRELEHTQQDVVELLKLARGTVRTHLAAMLGQGLVVPTRKIGRAQLYKLNEQSGEAMLLQRLFDMRLRSDIRRVER